MKRHHLEEKVQLKIRRQNDRWMAHMRDRLQRDAEKKLMAGKLKHPETPAPTWYVRAADDEVPGFDKYALHVWNKVKGVFEHPPPPPPPAPPLEPVRDPANDPWLYGVSESERAQQFVPGQWSGPGQEGFCADLDFGSDDEEEEEEREKEDNKRKRNEEEMEGDTIMAKSPVVRKKRCNGGGKSRSSQ
ncbi:hypothetical protein B0T17DRAFT_612547 [Bombardia bombarda]|uniref:Uncharacterized protein n=1 Tax=Bombardia bombarda TaxID=252184 RepID=A0AA39XLD8_9PEZI|nr:hypothetical protein B0T17DRAFT_612547 [Bombardia bombarda]